MITTVPNIVNRTAHVVVEEKFQQVIAPIMLRQGDVTRSDLEVPISPSDQPDGSEAFTDPRNGARLYLPDYALGEISADGQTRFDLRFHHDAPRDRWGLIVGLRKSPPGNLSGVAGQMREMPHDMTASLSFLAGSSRRELAFSDPVPAGDKVQVTCWLANVAERDLLYQALTTPEAAAQLTVTRSLTVAVKSDPATGGVSLLENGRLAVAGAQARTMRRARSLKGVEALLQRNGRRDQLFKIFGNVRADAFVRPAVKQTGSRPIATGRMRGIQYELTITNINAYGSDLFKQMPGTGKRPARMQVEIKAARGGKVLLRDDMRGRNAPYNPRSITLFGTDAETIDAVIVTMLDRKTGQTLNSGKVALSPAAAPPEERYALLDVTLPQTVEPTPFHFDPAVHPYVYDALSVAPPVPVQGGLARHREDFNGTVHSYFQDAVLPQRVYFLPDEFKIARRAGALHPPEVTVRVATEGAETQSTQVTMDYVIAPVVDTERLGEAGMKIAQATGLDPASLEFQPYLTEDITYVLARPTTDGRVTEERPASQLMLQEPMVDTLVMSQADFEITFDAMTGGSASAMTGEVRFMVEGWGQETRGVTLDFKDMAGPHYSVQPDMHAADPHAATVFLTNAIESPIGLGSLRIAAERNGLRQAIALPLDGIGPDTRLEPGQDADPQIRFDDLPGTGPVTITVLDPGQVEPDREAILDSILDRASLEYFREIELRTVPTLFPDPAGDTAPDSLFAILVEFDTGQAAALDFTTHSATVRVDFSFADAVLGNAVGDGTYRYRKTLVRMDGSQEQDADFIEGSSPILFVTPSVTPAVG